MDTTPKSGRVTSHPLEPLPQPQTIRIMSVERQAEAERSTELQSRISYDLKADLTFLRQVRSYQKPFVWGSDAMEDTAKELATQKPSRYNTFISARGRLNKSFFDLGFLLLLRVYRFASLTKKGVRDRIMKLLDHHGKGDAWNKRQ